MSDKSPVITNQYYIDKFEQNYPIVCMQCGEYMYLKIDFEKSECRVFEHICKEKYLKEAK